MARTLTCAVAEALRRTRVPLAAYYGITIVVPLFNGSGSTERAFLEHLTFVAVFPLTLVGLITMLGRLWRTTMRSARSCAWNASTSKGPGRIRRAPIDELNASVPPPLGR